MTQFFTQLGDMVLQYGDKAIESLANLEPEGREPLRRLVAEGLLARSNGHFVLTASATRLLEHKALADMLGQLGSKSSAAASSEIINDDLVSDAEMMQAVAQTIARGGGTSCPLGAGRSEVDRFLGNCHRPVRIALLLDMSYSMSRFGRFFQAKRAALALHAMVREHFPDDRVQVIGFHSTAEVIDEDRLPSLMPKEVGIVEKNVSLRTPLARSAEAPAHFTNLHMALRLARSMLVGDSSQADAGSPGGAGSHAFIVLDGEPTAYIDDGQLVVHYPPDSQTASVTLAEAQSLAKAGVQLASFALIDDYYYMDWVAFVDRMTRLTRGVGFYCGSGDLASCILESYIAAKSGQPQFAGGG